MGATLRRALRVLLLVTMLVGIGSAAGVSAAVALPAASNTPTVPSSTVQSNGPGSATYCVDNYAPNSTVVIVNQANGATGVIHTDNSGSGCTNIPAKTACDAPTDNTIVATGSGADGTPASSQATYTAPADPSQCVGTGGGGGTPTPGPCDPTQATLSVYVVAQGSSLRGTACGFTPGETVAGFILSKPVFIGNTTARADGMATVHGAIPVCIQPGMHTMVLDGETSGHVATADFRVKKSSACTSPATGSGGGTLGPTRSNQGGGPLGGLAFTGADIFAMVLAALVLLALGIVTVVTVRRRRTAPAA